MRVKESSYIEQALLFFMFSTLTMPSVGVKLAAIGTLKLSLIVALFVCIYFVLCGRCHVSKRVFYIVLPFCFYALTAFWSIDYYSSLIGVLGIIQLTIYVLSFFLLCRELTEDNFHKVIGLSCLCVLTLHFCYYFIGLISYNGSFLENEKIFGIMIDRGMIRAKGLTDDPNILSLYAGIVFIYALFNKNTVRYKAIIVSLSLVLTVLTLSRGGMLALVVAVFSILAIWFLTKPQKMLLFSIVASLFLIAAWSFLKDNPVVVDVVSKRIDNASSGSGRFYLWEYAFERINDSPILGHGIFTTKYIFIKLLGQEGYSHNTIIEILLEGGIFLLFIYIALFIVAIGYSLQKFSSQPYMLGCIVFILVQYQTLSLSFNEFIYFVISLVFIERGGVSKNA